MACTRKSSIASIIPFPRNISQRPIAAACCETKETQIPFPIYKPCKTKNLRDGILWRGESSRALKAPFVLLRAHTYRKGEQKRQSADLIFILLLESVLTARECMKYNRIKTQQEKKDLMQDSSPRQTLERSLAVLVRYEP